MCNDTVVEAKDAVWAICLDPTEFPTYNGAMLTDEELGRVCVVLARARNPANIGAVARAMHDFGFGTLRVVNEFPVPFEAAKSAVDASAVMANAASYATVAEAVADCTLVVGTTAVGERDVQHCLVTLEEAGAKIRAELRRVPTRDGKAVMNGAPGGGDSVSVSSYSGERRVAVLFGSEKTGLSNEELSHCNWLLTIPMYEHEGVRHPSMNLGQAVAVCLWELVRGPTHDGRAVMNGAPAEDVGAREPADAASLERVTALLGEVMEATEYTRRHAANCEPAMVRRLVRRMDLSAEDAAVWMGILRQVLWKVRV
jgi:tRNA C32,U32 (ribose-2'-O)-methylase TrmJ